MLLTANILISKNDFNIKFQDPMHNAEGMSTMAWAVNIKQPLYHSANLYLGPWRLNTDIVRLYHWFVKYKYLWSLLSRNWAGKHINITRQFLQTLDTQRLSPPHHMIASLLHMRWHVPYIHMVDLSECIISDHITQRWHHLLYANNAGTVEYT